MHTNSTLKNILGSFFNAANFNGLGATIFSIGEPHWGKHIYVCDNIGLDQQVNISSIHGRYEGIAK